MIIDQGNFLKCPPPQWRRVHVIWENKLFQCFSGVNISAGTDEVCFLLLSLTLLLFICNKQWVSFPAVGVITARGFLIGWKHSKLPDQLTAADQSESSSLMSPVMKPPPAERLIVANPPHTERSRVRPARWTHQAPKKLLQLHRGQNKLSPAHW